MRITWRRIALFPTSLLAMVLIASPAPEVQAQSKLLLVDLHSMQQMTLSDNPGEYRRPTFSPDERTVAFQRGDSTGYFIEIVSTADGTGRRYSLAHTPLDFEMRWSPDGRWLAYRADPQGLHSSRLQLLDPESGVERTLIETLVEQFVWRSDGQALRYVRHGAKHTVHEVLLSGVTIDLRALEDDIPSINGIQFGNYSTVLVGNSGEGVFAIPLPAGAPRMLSGNPRRTRVSGFADGRVVVPLRDPQNEVELVHSDGSVRAVPLPFEWAMYYVAEAPGGVLTISGKSANGGAGVFAVQPNGGVHLLAAVPPGSTVQWFDISMTGRFLAIASAEDSAAR
jgi:dipeptidyl aminopeptidase/acylaminoacyl peptidase